jgi:hypothetical protein
MDQVVNKKLKLKKKHTHIFTTVFYISTSTNVQLGLSLQKQIKTLFLYQRNNGIWLSGGWNIRSWKEIPLMMIQC